MTCRLKQGLRKCLIAFVRFRLRAVCFTHTSDSKAPSKPGRSQCECPVSNVPKMRHSTNAGRHHSCRTQKAAETEVENILSISLGVQNISDAWFFGLGMSNQGSQCKHSKIPENLTLEALLIPSCWCEGHSVCIWEPLEKLMASTSVMVANFTDFRSFLYFFFFFWCFVSCFLFFLKQGFPV